MTSQAEIRQPLLPGVVLEGPHPRGALVKVCSPRDYIEAIRTAEAGGIEVLVIDSLSHAWAGKGGVLDVETLVQARLHLIVTMRTKTEYVLDKDEKGRAVPRKLGLQPVQRDGLEYEFDIVGDMSPEHELVVSKSRCPALSDAVIRRPGADVAQVLRSWLDGAGLLPKEQEPEVPDVRGRIHCAQGWAELDRLGEEARANHTLDLDLGLSILRRRAELCQNPEQREALAERLRGVRGITDEQRAEVIGLVRLEG